MGRAAAKHGKRTDSVGKVKVSSYDDGSTEFVLTATGAHKPNSDISAGVPGHLVTQPFPV